MPSPEFVLQSTDTGWIMNVFQKGSLQSAMGRSTDQEQHELWLGRQEVLEFWVLKSWLQQATPGTGTTQGGHSLCIVMLYLKSASWPKGSSLFLFSYNHCPPSSHRGWTSRWGTVNVQLTALCIFHEEVLEIMLPIIKTV